MDNTCCRRLWKISASIEEAIAKILDRGIFVWKKQDSSPVTNIDIAIQDIIIELIQSQYPEDNIICEEGYNIYDRKNSIYSWVVDPIDGTDNFIQGKKEFGISVGLLQEHEFIEALLFFPKLGERYYAAKNLGVWKNGRVFFADEPMQEHFEKDVILCSKTFERLNPVFEAGGYRVNFYNCATYSLLMLLKRRAFMYHTINTMIYDVGPMAFIISESGIPGLNGVRKHLVFSPSKRVIPFFLALSNGDLKDEVYRLLKLNK